ARIAYLHDARYRGDALTGNHFAFIDRTDRVHRAVALPEESHVMHRAIAAEHVDRAGCDDGENPGVEAAVIDVVRLTSLVRQRLPGGRAVDPQQRVVDAVAAACDIDGAGAVAGRDGGPRRSRRRGRVRNESLQRDPTAH